MRKIVRIAVQFSYPVEVPTNNHGQGHNYHAPRSWTISMLSNALPVSLQELLHRLHQEQRTDTMTLW